MGQVFEYPFIKAFYLRSRTPVELTQKLAPSFAKYYGKDALVVVIKDRKKGAAFSILERQSSVRTVSFNELCPPAPASTAAENPINQSCIGPSTDDVHERYTTADTDAIIKIQRLWRSCSVKIESRRSYVSLPEFRATTRLFNMGAQCAAAMKLRDRIAVQRLLLLQCVPLCLRLGAAREQLSKIQQDAMTCVENVEISTESFESVDNVLHRNGEAETLLRKAEEKMSDACIVEVVKMGVLPMLEKAMKDVQKLVVEAELGMLETRKILDAVS